MEAGACDFLHPHGIFCPILLWFKNVCEFECVFLLQTRAKIRILKPHLGFFKLDSAQSDRLAEVLHTIHLADSVRTQAGNLSHGQKQWLEIGMLLMQDPKLLLLDEPVAGMTDHETERTAELFLTLKGKHSLMVVEHDMGFIKTISDIVTVLCDGSVLAQGTLDQVQSDERVIEVYLGR
ncbi:MAG: Lipopolysaccharide export system ATP-binding protein LptB [Pseudomonadota bacterium]